ncbi:MAG TPA: GNAT family N-acetyltransferase [Jatrophihabitantaceae bacterium]
MTATLRLAAPEDAPVIAELCRASVLELFPAYYDSQQTASSSVHTAALDRTLIDDGTYFVHDVDGDLVACGGWSRRNKLYNATDAGADDRLLDPQHEPARIRAMFVRADWTRRGLGRAILEACVDAARAEGFRTLALMATLPGVPLYEAFGFVAVERAVLTLPDGVQVDAVAMRRPIDEQPG